MSTAVHDELLESLTELRRLLPSMRLGQLISNMATVARGAVPGAVWEMEDTASNNVNLASAGSIATGVDPSQANIRRSKPPIIFSDGLSILMHCGYPAFNKAAACHLKYWRRFKSNVSCWRGQKVNSRLPFCSGFGPSFNRMSSFTGPL